MPDLELVTSLAVTDEDRMFQAQALVRSYCGWHIAPEREDIYVPTGLGPTRVLLPSLRVTGVAITRNDVELVRDLDYTWDDLLVILPFGWMTDELVITFTHGYEEVPDDVAAVVQGLAQRAVNNPRMVLSEQAGPFAATYPAIGGSLSDADKANLNPYRIIHVA